MEDLGAQALADLLFLVLDKHEGSRTPARLRMRLRELGKKRRDEDQQFLLLQRACREDPQLAAELEQVGLGKIAELSAMHRSATRGRLVQAFNHMIEEHWESY